MEMNLFSFSEAYKTHYPGVGFGLTLISECQNDANPPGFDQHKRKLLRKMRKRETLARITARIDIYDRFFQDFGHPCPLTKHLKRTINSGFPRYDLMVDAHIMAEMCAGILVAVTDFDHFDGSLTLDVAAEDENCRGMAVRSLKQNRVKSCCGTKKKSCVFCVRGLMKRRVFLRIHMRFFFMPMPYPALT